MNTEKTVVALDPTSHGYGFVFFDGISKLIDWGHTQIRPNRRKKTLESIASLLGRYNPDVVVIEDWHSPHSRRRGRVKELLRDVADFVSEAKKEIECYSPMEVASSFAPYGQITKYDIAELIAEAYPELISRLPPRRKIWMSEDERTSIFDAAALALTYYYGLEDIEG
ncbi:MAG: hypothetical protein AAF391_00190 [Bacteroidota bacterium]